MGYVYILQSLVNGRFYIGSTKNIARRLLEHNSGKSKYTKLTKPFKLVFDQKYPTITDAKRIEYKIKKLKSRKIIKRIIKDQFVKLRV